MCSLSVSEAHFLGPPGGGSLGRVPQGGGVNPGEGGSPFGATGGQYLFELRRVILRAKD